MSSWFSRAAVSVSNAVANKQVVVEKSTADLKIDEIAEYVNNLETNMEKASQAASLLVKRHIDLSNAQGEIGTAFVQLGLFSIITPCAYSCRKIYIKTWHLPM